MTSLADRCIEVLRTNDRGAYTVPTRNLYPHRWAWDSAFAAIGWAHVDRGRALTELQTLMASMWPDGRVPHIEFDLSAKGYWPGPDFWDTERSSAITQPPIWASAARRLVELEVDLDDIAPLLPAMDRSHAFFRAQRDPEGRGWVAVAHPWESGQDNSPAWDTALGNIDPSQAPPFRREDLQHVEDPSERPTDDHYKRYAVIVRSIVDAGYGLGVFGVYDPSMTALLIQAERDLEFLASAAGVESQARVRADELERALMSDSWMPELGRFAYRDAHTGIAIHPNVLGAHLPLILDLDAPTRIAVLESLQPFLDTPHPLPSTAPNDVAFDPRRYWRGPTWVSTNWLMMPHLSDSLRASTIELVDRSGFWEYFDPMTGEGLGTDHFTWSAALVLDLLSSA